MDYKTITFYKYVNLKNPEETKGYIKGLCQGLNLLGRILVGKEGINAGISGRKEDIEKFKQAIEAKREFADLTYREQDVEKNSYHKLVVKTRKEIVALGKEVNMRKKGKHVSPERLKKWIDRKEDIIILDARNDYEAKIGKFKDAVVLPIKTFREFPDAAEKALQDKKDKKIVMYCTGGIRCEKSSAYLREKGFKNVFQLKGGIINYANQFPSTHYEGKCFVFDDRLSGDVKSEDVLTNCELCGTECDTYIDCHNMDCDKLTLSCKGCQEKFNMTCSESCKNAPRHRNNNPRLIAN